ncbi:MAG: NAD(P)-dependent glycerol-3-phosphate dehydrogenase [Methylobacterium sp.]|jgi:glycerol-3-phosphate dehydrogenase (NAD(P)+)|nr:NAD(P)-dependent glycerol-3-phosphate dehydrogenase [Methylobacterium sp.]MCA3597209.1 NAD(P)-dependent glycerol-3-phosphate dehydrogenase [Methylobacterium sp.]MCA3599821.1 NAD(P)-dependent glycerol-3-phosphate dehydrogenase [Methylobacterium sp.]MCA3603116.1 NAD(P)-dependent glycerol-3-phosphate dehydrogenase [Methylobacterium sp.]MCA3607264.1 NAD(P)-dependent glycerol-3-phosphate dehydrogenase [Methylobacterium sp.]
MITNKVAVLGAGAFGTALALAFARAGRDVSLWGRDAERMEAMAKIRLCDAALPGLPLDPRIAPVADLAALAQAPVLVLAVPTQALRSVSEALALVLSPGHAVVAAAKGMEQGSGQFVTEVMADELGPQRFGVLSGPSFAEDIARGLPTAVSLAMAEGIDAQALAAHLGSPGFRIYHTTDIRGLEIGGAAKNVLAIAAGIVAGLGLGESARAAIVTRGFAELRRFAGSLGARAETLMGLSGLGDLMLTASSAQSRNFSLGLALGQGKALQEASGGKLAEGAFTAAALDDMARARGIDMPIVAGVRAILDGKLGVKDAVAALMARPFREE